MHHLPRFYVWKIIETLGYIPWKVCLPIHGETHHGKYIQMDKWWSAVYPRDYQDNTWMDCKNGNKISEQYRMASVLTRASLENLEYNTHPMDYRIQSK